MRIRHLLIVAVILGLAAGCAKKQAPETRAVLTPFAENAQGKEQRAGVEQGVRSLWSRRGRT